MASIVLTVMDESLLTQIKKACLLLKGVDEVKVLKQNLVKDVTKTKGYQEAMEDVRLGRVTEYASVNDFITEMELDAQISTVND